MRKVVIGHGLQNESIKRRENRWGKIRLLSKKWRQQWATHLEEEEQAENNQPMSQNKYINKEKREERGEILV